MSCQHTTTRPERDKDRLAYNDRGAGVIRVYRCLDCGRGVTQFLLQSEICPNCSDPSAEGGHLGAQGWLCEPTPEVADATVIAHAILAASRARGES